MNAGEVKMMKQFEHVLDTGREVLSEILGLKKRFYDGGKRKEEEGRKVGEGGRRKESGRRRKDGVVEGGIRGRGRKGGVGRKEERRRE